MNERPSFLGTVVIWIMVIVIVGAVLAHVTPTGRHLIRAIPLHVGP